MHTDFKSTQSGRLDKIIASQFPQFTRVALQEAIAAGMVQVNQAVVLKNNFRVNENDTITIQLPQPKIVEAKEIPLNVVYRNHGLIVVDKPPGITVHGGPAVAGITLTQGLLFRFPQLRSVGLADRPGIVHRLDKDTSGLLLIAETQAMYDYLKQQFAQQKIEKTYLALVTGSIHSETLEITASIGKDSKDFRLRTVQRNALNPKPAHTSVTVLEHLDGYMLIRVRLHTGRTHQIRVHLTSIGHGIAGDMLYNKKADHPKGLDRQFLHAAEVSLVLPNGDSVHFESQLPTDLDSVLKELRAL